MTKGASEAFATFKQTGEQTFAVNSAVLKVLAETEKSAQEAAKIPGFWDSLTIGGEMVKDDGTASTGEQNTAFWSQAGAAIGAYFSGGTLKEASLAAYSMTAPEAQAEAISEAIRKAGEDRMSGNVSALDQMVGNFNLKLEQLAIMLGKMGA
jgi:hypothetical protein